MKKLRDFCWKIFFLPGWLTVLIAVPSFALVILSFVDDGSIEWLSMMKIPVYSLSAYALTITCTWLARVISRFSKFLKSTSFYKKLQEDIRLKTMVTMIPGLVLNALYVFTNIRLGMLNHTAWFIYLGIYYLLLTIMKSLLLYDLATNRHKEDLQREYQKYRSCGIALLLLNFVLSGECVYIVVRNQSYHYDGMLIYAMAAMAFYKMISAIVHLVRYRKYQSPVISAVNSDNLTAAMVTMLALETAMIEQFGSESQENFRQTMTSISAAAVCLIELVMAIYMIVKATQKIKGLNQEQISAS